MLRIDNHVFSLIRYPVQSDLFPLVIRCQHVIEGHDCHIFADVFCWDRILIPGVGDEAVFLYPSQVDFVDDVLPKKGFRPSFFNRSKGTSLVVVCTFSLTLLHQAMACPFRSARLLYLIPTMKLSRANCTVRSTFPLV